MTKSHRAVETSVVNGRDNWILLVLEMNRYNKPRNVGRGDRFSQGLWS